MLHTTWSDGWESGGNRDGERSASSRLGDHKDAIRNWAYPLLIETALIHYLPWLSQVTTGRTWGTSGVVLS